MIPALKNSKEKSQTQQRGKLSKEEGTWWNVSRLVLPEESQQTHDTMWFPVRAAVLPPSSVTAQTNYANNIPELLGEQRRDGFAQSDKGCSVTLGLTLFIRSVK